MKPFVDELKVLNEKGLKWVNIRAGGGNVTTNVFPLIYTADSCAMLQN